MTEDRDHTSKSGASGAGLSRRGFLHRTGLVASGVIAVSLLATSEAEAKVKKKVVGYQDTPKGAKRCDNCRHYLAGKNACKLVEGEIAADGWCRLWSKAKS